MDRPGLKLTEGPQDGERYMTTNDFRRWLRKLDALGDDGTALVEVRSTSIHGRVMLAWTVLEPGLVLTPDRDWDQVLAGARQDLELEAELVEADGEEPLPPLESDLLGEARELPPGEEPTGRTMEIPAAAVQPPPAALEPSGPRHRKQ